MKHQVRILSILCLLSVSYACSSQKFLVDTKQVRYCNGNSDCGKWSEYLVTRNTIILSDSSIIIKGANTVEWKIDGKVEMDGVFYFELIRQGDDERSGEVAICDFIVMNRGTWLFVSHGTYEVLYLLIPPKRKWMSSI